jgi:flagellin-like protein
MWKMRKDKSAVSPVIATILMVAITVVLAAVLYVMVMGFGGSGSNNTPTASLSYAKTGSGAYTFTVNSVSSNNLAEGNVQIIINPTTGTGTGSLATIYAATVTAGVPTTMAAAAVWSAANTYTVIEASGTATATTMLGAGDHFSLTTLTVGTTYNVLLKDVSTGGTVYTINLVA